MTLTRFSGGSMLDHIGWATPDAPSGCARLAELTGATPFLMAEPEPEQWYWSGGLPLGGGQLLEVIGPAPAFSAHHPLHGLLRALPAPRLFWYVGTDDIDAFAAAASAAGVTVSPIETNDYPAESGLSCYRRCMLLGSTGGFDPVVPSVIQWTRRRAEFDSSATSGVTLRRFELQHPDAAGISVLFEHLGIDQPIRRGPEPALTLVLDTPNGVVELEGRGNPADLLGAG
jgi:hypothetical protein